jgi:uncharacterized cupin superfamily protein
MLPLASKTDVPLRSAPIEPTWILEGTPVARSAELSRSRDGTANTVVWDCTEGRFQWIFDVDETIHILEGEVTIETDTMSPTRFGPGDVVFFPNGSRTRWHVHGYLRKLAFCRRTMPRPVGFALRVAARLKRHIWEAIRPPSVAGDGVSFSPQAAAGETSLVRFGL